MSQELVVEPQETFDVAYDVEAGMETAFSFSADFPRLQELFERQLLSIGQVQETTAAYADKLLTAVLERDVEAAQLEAIRLQEALMAWRADVAAMRETAETVVPLLQDELSVRSDLSLMGFQEGWRTESSLIDEVMLTEAPRILVEIVAYDKERAERHAELSIVLTEILKIQQALATWQTGETDPLLKSPTDEGAPDTLSEITLMLAEAQDTLTRSVRRHAQLRTMGFNAIQRGVRRLLDLGEPEETVMIDNVTLIEIQNKLQTDWSDENLVFLEKQIQSKVNKYSLERKSTKAAQLAQNLGKHWDNSAVVDLLEVLAAGGDDVQAALLLLAANNSHPRSANIKLSGKAVYSLLRGVGRLSQRAAPFDLLNLLAGSFLSGWETDDTVAQAELCLVFIAAYFGGRYELPEGILWQLPSDWPMEGMPNWQILWQSLLLSEEPVTIVLKTEDDTQEALNAARRKAQDTLTMRDGRFTRVTPIKSDRHRHMLGAYLLPRLDAYQNRLNHFEQQWQEAKPYQEQHLTRSLKDWLSEELGEALSEDGVTELYEAGITEHDIRDDHPFFKKSSLTFATNAGKDVLNFAQALLAAWEESQQDVSQVVQADLAQEIVFMSPKTTLGQIALNEIFEDQSTPHISREKDIVLRQSCDILSQELLAKSDYALVMPRLVGSLTKHPFRWSQLLPYLLEDIADPVLAEQAAKLLLQVQAPWHALLLAIYVDRETQKQAQQMQQEMQKKIEGLEIAVLKLNGRIKPDLQKAKELGRYQYVRAQLERQQDELQAQRAEQTRVLQAQGRKLRQSINDLDNDLFEIQSEIPHDAFAEIEKGFQAARQALHEPADFSSVKEYIEEIQYRLNHRSWRLLDIHDATNRLIQELADEQELDTPNLTVNEILEHFKDNELRSLGLNPEDVVSSQVDTRIRILEDWLIMKETESFLTTNMSSKQTRHIRHFYQYFSRMLALKQKLNPHGQPLEFDDPTIYRHSDLKYPRAKILKERRLILVTLPGVPPSPQTIGQLERTIVEKEWLEAGSNYAFVVVFIPNCTEDIKKRLQRNFANQGLVIIDEAALLDMCLTIKADQNAIGRLRPLLLNSLDIRNISIYHVNQACHPSISIFVGRQSLITAVANSHDNYAIYGGRRIGKTSVLLAIKDRLDAQGVLTVSYSFEGVDASDLGTAHNLASRLGLEGTLETVDAFKLKVQKKLDENADLHIVLLLDEVDRYINANPLRHQIIESMRDLSDQNSGRFRVVISGFMGFFDCLRGRGPYSPSSDPWRRMLNDSGPLGNLRAENAEEIVREGFLNVLGWEFEHPMIPERIVLRTGGHPAFVQYFCGKIQELVGKRNGHMIRLNDIEAVFADTDPAHSFIGFVRKTLELNLEAMGQFLIVWLASFYHEATTFTVDEIDEVFDSVGQEIPGTHLDRALERLEVTSVVKVRAEGVYEFSVPDYPNILYRLGDTTHLDELESNLMGYLAEIKAKEI